MNPTNESFIDTTAQIGGPFIQDKLWFFVSAQYFKEESSDGGPIRTEESPRLFGKLSWQLNEQNSIDGWLEWDRYDIIGRGGDSVTPLEATVTEDAPEYVGNVSWRSILSENTILNVSYGGYDGYYYLDPNQGYDIAGRYDGATGLYNTNSTYFYLADRTRNQIVASVSHFADDFIKGDHDFKFGMELERSTVRSRYGAPTGVWFYDNYGYYDDPGTEEYDYVPYTQGYYNYSYDLKGTVERQSLFAQDSWRISPTFTVNVGVRAEFNHGSVPGEGNIFDNTAVAPRLGFAWDMTRDGKTVLKGALRPLLREVRRHRVLLRAGGRLHAARVPQHLSERLHRGSRPGDPRRRGHRRGPRPTLHGPVHPRYRPRAGRRHHGLLHLHSPREEGLHRDRQPGRHLRPRRGHRPGDRPAGDGLRLSEPRR